MCRKILTMCAVIGWLGGSVMGDPVLPVFDAANFVPGAAIDNTYFPLEPGTVYTYEGEELDEDNDPVPVVIEEFVTFITEDVGGVTARVVRAREWIDGLPVEHTFDYYAQDMDGNVWYLGELSTSYEYDDEDNLIGLSNAGSWRAGENGALPGYIMKAGPAVGDEYFQEHAPADGALDEAEITSLTALVSIDLGDFTNVLVALESTELEPGAYGNKLYAPGIGLVLIEEGVDEFGGNPENTIPLVSVEMVPEPATGCLLAGGLMMTMLRRCSAQVFRRCSAQVLRRCSAQVVRRRDRRCEN